MYLLKMYEIKDVKNIFKNVSRIIVKNSEGEIETDVNNIFFKFKSNKLNLKFMKNFETGHDYTMSGKIFKENSTNVIISYGGLLMNVPTKMLGDYSLEEQVYCLIDFL